MIYRVVFTQDLRGTLWGRDGTYPEWVTADDLYPPGPDQAEQLRRLVDEGSIVEIPEAE